MIIGKGFKEEELSVQAVRKIRDLARQVRADVLRMTHLAGSGPSGGAFSVAEALLTLLAGADIDPTDAENPKRDRVIVTHEHATPTLYAALGRLDFFDLDDAVSLYRKAGSIFEGALERSVPGVEWGGASQGQGLSVACGMALSARWHINKPNIFVVMSDEEQQRGEIAEARRFAKKYRLNNVTAIIDANNVQSAGKTSEIMPQNIKYEYIADGWDVIEINGHEPAELYQAVRRASQIQSTPVLVIANTTMGCGVSFMENQPEYYSRRLTDEEYEEAMRELSESSSLDEAADYRVAFGDFDIEFTVEEPSEPRIEIGEPRTYTPDSAVSNLGAFREALCDVGEVNKEVEEGNIAVFDCAHVLEVGVDAFAQKNHERFLQAGLSNQGAATIAAAMSFEGIAPVIVDFGVNALAENYGQLRQADLNRSSLKVVATNLGLDAGSMGKSIQCIDYIGLAANLFGFKIILPADANETDRALRYMLKQPGNWILGVNSGDSSIITDEKGAPLFGGDYQYEYGSVVRVRDGEGGVLLSSGHMLGRALKVWEKLAETDNAPELLHVSDPLEVDRAEDEVLLKALRKGRVVTYEDHNSRTGLGGFVANVIAKRGISCRLMTLGTDAYCLSGDAEDLYKWSGLDVETVAAKTAKFIKKR